MDIEGTKPVDTENEWNPQPDYLKLLMAELLTLRFGKGETERGLGGYGHSYQLHTSVETERISTIKHRELSLCSMSIGFAVVIGAAYIAACVDARQTLLGVLNASFILCIGITFCYIARRSLRLLRKSLEDKLAKSDILTMVAYQDERLLSIYEKTPRILSDLFLPASPSTLKAAVKLVALNLDWYLAPEQNWVIQTHAWKTVHLLATMTIAVACILLLLAPAGALYFAFFYPVFLMLITWLVLIAQKETRIEALIQHIGELLTK